MLTALASHVLYDDVEDVYSVLSYNTNDRYTVNRLKDSNHWFCSKISYLVIMILQWQIWWSIHKHTNVEYQSMILYETLKTSFYSIEILKRVCCMEF